MTSTPHEDALPRAQTWLFDCPRCRQPVALTIPVGGRGGCPSCGVMLEVGGAPAHPAAVASPASKVPVLTEERRAQIVRLLETLDDGLPSPARAPLSSLGFVHRAVFRESCPDCLANGFASSDCETCSGAGFLEGRRSRDPYDTGQNRGWLGAASLEAAKERDREIARLEAQTAAPRPERELAAKVKPESWEIERRRLRGVFDYELLAAALERLAVEDPDACHALHAVFVYGYLRPAATSARGVLERGLRLLSSWLPERLRAPSPIDEVEVLVPDLRVRNAAVRRRARQEGATSQMLAREYGLSVSQVNRILAGQDEPE